MFLSVEKHVMQHDMWPLTHKHTHTHAGINEDWLETAAAFHWRTEGISISLVDGWDCEEQFFLNT